MAKATSNGACALTAGTRPEPTTNLEPGVVFGNITSTTWKLPAPSAIAVRVSANTWVVSRVSTVVERDGLARVPAHPDDVDRSPRRDDAGVGEKYRRPPGEGREVWTSAGRVDELHERCSVAGPVEWNATRTTHVASGFTVAPLHASDVIVKSPGFAPVSDTVRDGERAAADVGDGQRLVGCELPERVQTEVEWHRRDLERRRTWDDRARPPTSWMSVVITEGGVPAGIARPSGLLAANGVPVTSRSTAVRMPTTVGAKASDTTHGVSRCRIA